MLINTQEEQVVEDEVQEEIQEEQINTVDESSKVQEEPKPKSNPMTDVRNQLKEEQKARKELEQKFRISELRNEFGEEAEKVAKLQDAGFNDEEIAGMVNVSQDTTTFKEVDLSKFGATKVEVNSTNPSVNEEVETDEDIQLRKAIEYTEKRKQEMKKYS